MSSRPALASVFRPVAFALLAALAASPALAADPAPAALAAAPFGDGMVLQRGMKVPVWGTATAGAEVTVKFAGQTKQAKADDKGAWRVELEPLKASATGAVLTIAAGKDKQEIKDVLVGEVWLCSGQSNMEWGVAQAEGGLDTMFQADPKLRMRMTAHVAAPAPATALNATAWFDGAAAQRAQVGKFSAVAYVFACELRDELKVPVGLIGASFGGTPIEAWTPPGATALPNSNARPPKHHQDAVLYNGMVSPWAGFALRGALWYQGESNVISHDTHYTERMQALVGGWRKAWGQGDFPFYFVQLAPFNYVNGKDPKMTAQSLPEMWEAQARAAELIPNAGMAGTADVGNMKDIHPRDKVPVGRRLALLALARTYGQKLTVSASPVCTGMEVKGAKAVLNFKEVGAGLKARDGKALTGFEVAGDDGVFVPAEAKLAGKDQIEVSSAKVAKPVQVRFAWDQSGAANLVNSGDLPAWSFRLPVAAAKDAAKDAAK